ncbi:ABC transporter ATP-binding protein [Treponema sp.]|uniref:energy-coupling factor ABC transporter ATP-binding protein n=1 Tax=Treponema sp. TaxID=166 RepID=UPI00298D806D|nr:ABC transporter ATP-binding protein [Treponema sp.]MCR5612715.1 energy-coupling factor ABC transporter ATP-binding protein [Treponema sp.]
MIKVEHISKTFETPYGAHVALKDVSFEIPDGKCVLIGGENGSGKSVLMSIIAGLEDPDSGNISTRAENRDTAPRRGNEKSDHDDEKPDRAGNGSNRGTGSESDRVGLVFQEAETQILGETPREDIAFGPKNLDWKTADINAAVESALEKVGLTEKADFPARFLSGGEKRRLAVACMLAMNLDTIILDEPYANLDLGGVRQVNKVIASLKAEKKTVIVLTHELEKCLGLADKMIVLFRGQKVFDGSADEALKMDLEQWNIRNPITSYKTVKDLVW